MNKIIQSALLGFIIASIDLLHAQSSGCVKDINSYCSYYRDLGYCKDRFYEEWMSINCCDTCHPDGCRDKKSKCPQYANRGYCEKTFVAWMKRNCCKSCKRGCTDLSENCPKYAKTGYCSASSAFYKWMKKNCCSSCSTDEEKKEDETKPKTIEEGRCLKSANDFRDKHEDTPHLQWDDELTREAQYWAEELKKKTVGWRQVAIDHDPRNGDPDKQWGENIWFQNEYKKVGTCEDANKAWYSEIKDWDLKNGRWIRGVTTHFTAMVWKATTKVGYGKVVFPSPVPGYKDNTVTIVVAKYWTRANWVMPNEYIDHVRPLKGSDSGSDGNKSIKKVTATEKPSKSDEKKTVKKTSEAGGTQDVCLKSANEYRAKHKNTPALVWDDELAREAQYYAEELKKKSERERQVAMDHDPRNGAKEWGENIWYTNQYQQTGSCADANKDWYEEINDWDIEAGRAKCCVTTHFTAMVWTATTKVGYGKVVFNSPDPFYMDNTVTIVVAKYHKRGNWVAANEYTTYVQPLIGTSGGTETSTDENKSVTAVTESTDDKKVTESTEDKTVTDSSEDKSDEKKSASKTVDKDMCLSSANGYRDLHVDTPALQWDDELTRESQSYAEQLKQQSISRGYVVMDHDPRNGDKEWGENIWYQNQPNNQIGTCEDANKSWYAEIKDWDISAGRAKCCVTTHFTAMVWTATTKVGYGKVVFPSPDQSYPDNTVTIVVAKYWTRGNWVARSDYVKYVKALKS